MNKKLIIGIIVAFVFITFLLSDNPFINDNVNEQILLDNAYEEGDASFCEFVSDPLKKSECMDLSTAKNRLETLDSCPRCKFHTPVQTEEQEDLQTTYIGTVVAIIAFMVLVFYLFQLYHMNNKLKRHEKLILEVKQQMNNGYHENSIKVKLKKEGFQDNIIEHIIKVAKK